MVIVWFLSGIFSFFFYSNLSSERNGEKHKEKGKRSSGKRRRKNEHRAALLLKPHENGWVRGTETQRENERLMEKFWMEIFEKSAV